MTDIKESNIFSLTLSRRGFLKPNINWSLTIKDYIYATSVSKNQNIFAIKRNDTFVYLHTPFAMQVKKYKTMKSLWVKH